MPFEPQNRLEESLMKAATDPAHRPQFYHDLIESDLFIIQEGDTPIENGRTVLGEGNPIRVRSVQWEGKEYLPIFSSLPRLQMVLQGEAVYIMINAMELMKITRGADILMNPGSEYGKIFSKEEVASIIDGTIWEPKERYVAEKETEIMIGQPANYPTELVEALARYFKTKKEVKSAYLAHFFNPERDEKPHSLVGVEVTGNWDDVISGAALVVGGVTVPDPPVDFLQITGGVGVEEYFTRECEPFYQKKRFGIFR